MNSKSGDDDTSSQEENYALFGSSSEEAGSGGSQDEDEMDENSQEVDLLKNPADFILSPPIAEEELIAISPQFRENISVPLELFRKEGYAAYQAYLVKEREEQEAKARREEAQKLESLQDAAIRSDPRDYQKALFEVAKQQNTIINLGTGKGKTLIALLVIRHFAAAYDEGKQTLFLVPSVALAIQQTTTLQANLPYTVATACRTVSNAEQKRLDLANANIIVATHGAMNDLFMHYEDLFQMERFNLVVIDECHYATRNHNYASIMNKWYHTLDADKRPHVLGLTASPLVNVKHTHSDDQLETMLARLERMLDAKVASLAELDIESPESNLLHKTAEERHIVYKDETNSRPLLPSRENVGLHPSRHRELQQLDGLYADLGPLPLSIYCKILAREVSRNCYEQETPDEFRCLVKHLYQIAEFCEEQCASCDRNGRSDKLLALEEQLERLVECHGGSDTVGLVFVERRITALALQSFLLHRKSAVQEAIWIRANQARRNQRAIATASSMDGSSSSDTQKATSRRDKVVTHLKVQPPHVPELRPGKNCTSQYHDPDDDCGIVGNDTDPTMGASTEETIESPSSNYCAVVPNQFDDASEDSGAYIVRSMDELPPAVTPFGPIDGQFDDAEESDLEDFPVPLQIARVDTEAEDASEHDGVSVVSGQFSHAEDDVDVDTVMNSTGEMGDDDSSFEPNGDAISSGVMVRHATHVFKYLNRYNKGNGESDNAEDDAWFHQDQRIRDVMRQLRKTEINVLICTSIVEEGVDVQACSFVIVFDALKSAKAYIQMKGRARQQNAKFVVLEKDTATNAKGRLSLETAQLLERRVHDFIERRGKLDPSSLPDVKPPDSFLRIEGTMAAKEYGALQARRYQATNGSVDLVSAKGLLNKYSMAIPLDASARTTREAFLTHMPVYENYQLLLPAHLPAEVRLVQLPEEYHSADKSERHQMLALMACVRLHGLRLLSDRLLPLTRNDLHDELLSVAKQDVAELSTYSSKVSVLFEAGQRAVYLYPIIQSGTTFSDYQRILQGDNRSLAIISIEKISPDIPDMVYPHNQLGEITCSLGAEQTMRFNLQEWDECASFFATLFNGRWRHRSRGEYFRQSDKDEAKGILPAYIVGCLSNQGKLDWEHMRRIVSEAARDEQSRTAAVRQSTQLGKPSLWAPLYDPLVVYVAYGPSDIDCSSPFPDKIPGVDTFQDYFAKQRDFKVPEDSQLFVAQRLWHFQSESLASRRLRLARMDGQQTSEFYSPPSEPKPPPHGHETCENLVSVLLPIDACMETEVSDAYMALICTMLPQFLYHTECHLTVDAFRRHCNSLPFLARCLDKVPRDRILEALSALSCQLEQSYDRLEWLGDAVLKLLQTDALLHSPDLRKWVQCLHEGDLTKLRSEMGCNERLAYSCKRLGINQFILTRPLQRGKWTPKQLQLWSADQTPITVSEPPGTKVCADAVEALLGLVYVTSGYDAAVEVACELGVSMQTDGDEGAASDKPECFTRPALLEVAKASIGKDDFHSLYLLEEALTHPSAVYQDVSSYQRLEWVGDAVLCLAMREWVYYTFPDMEVGDSVNMESALVSNETLAYLCFQNGIHTFINHRDQSLPARLEKYEWTVKELGRGLWGTDPPKVISDVVEALLGAAHVDGGFSEGQRAALHICSPITSLFEASQNGEYVNPSKLTNPKTTMHALAGNMLCIDAAKEEEFARAKGKEMVWQGDRWRHPDLEATDHVATISCLGINVLSIAETSKKSAGNRACAMAVALVEKDPNLLAALQEVRRAIDLGNSLDSQDDDEASQS